MALNILVFATVPKIDVDVEMMNLLFIISFTLKCYMPNLLFNEHADSYLNFQTWYHHDL